VERLLGVVMVGHRFLRFASAQIFSLSVSETGIGAFTDTGHVRFTLSPSLISLRNLHWSQSERWPQSTTTGRRLLNHTNWTVVRGKSR
jgi:hypothetical protein